MINISIDNNKNHLIDNKSLKIININMKKKKIKNGNGYLTNLKIFHLDKRNKYTILKKSLLSEIAIFLDLSRLAIKMGFNIEMKKSL